jgi:hypothetical protein
MFFRLSFPWTMVSTVLGEVGFLAMITSVC